MGNEAKRYLNDGDLLADGRVYVLAAAFDAQSAEHERVLAVMRDECRKAEDAAEAWRRQFADAQATIARLEAEARARPTHPESAVSGERLAELIEYDFANPEWRDVKSALRELQQRRIGEG